ncbi:MAG: phospho-N-acetylmuramoyl-pentapeptide-transferase [Candidatus Liptonbacteria bacterium]|nr:phospho-N-acetylmuramoyl-pentapeptide-transferase [Candidatus Liptonbacteria bacterium]
MATTAIIIILTITILSFFVAFISVRFVYKGLLKFGIKKQIRVSDSTPVFSALHAKKAGTPTMGGVIIWGTVLGLSLLFFVLDKLFGGFFSYLNFIDRGQTYLPLATMFIAAAFGLFDDFLGVKRIGPKGGGLSIKHKLILYTVIAFMAAIWFYSKLEWSVLYIPFFGNFEIGVWYVPVFMFIIIASAFSANETDGLDGLLGGIMLFVFGALMIISFFLGKYYLAMMIGSIIGSLLAFLWFNIYPAKFFMGDTGSMALGITLGVVAMLTNTLLLLPLLVLPLVIESLSVIIQLTSKKFFKRKVFLSAPIHHHFEALGMPESQITMRFWIFSFVCASLGIIIFFLDYLFK